MTELFSIDRVSKSGAKFSIDKAKCFNQKYLQQKNDTEIAQLFQTILKEKNISAETAYVEKVVTLVKERAVFTKD